VAIKLCKNTLAAALLLMVSWAMIPPKAFASDPLQMKKVEEDVVETAEELGERRKSADWVWMPVPVLNPTLDAGLAFAVLRLYKLHPDSPPSTTGLGGLATTNGSWGGGLFTKNYIREDRIRITGGIAYADLNLNFYGIGNNSREFDRLKINQRGTAGFGQALFRLGRNLYGGVRLRYLSLTSQLRYLPEDSFSEIPPEQLLDFGLQLDSIGPGIKFEWDTRSDAWFPTAGHYAEFSVDTSRKSFGADRDYEQYNLKWSGYWSVGDNDVLAANATGCLASDKAPFYDICLLGSSKNLRGFEGGRYRDETMLTGQVEYRKQLASRWGVVLFGGLGQVADSFGRFNRENIRTSAGFGVRWVASEEHGVRLSIDLAWGEGESAAYFYIGEAF
jgi:outer membrane protein assembly factor BamA